MGEATDVVIAAVAAAEMGPEHAHLGELPAVNGTVALPEPKPGLGALELAKEV
jgi:hypothetical protein